MTTSHEPHPFGWYAVYGYGPYRPRCHIDPDHTGKLYRLDGVDDGPRIVCEACRAEIEQHIREMEKKQP